MLLFCLSSNIIYMAYQDEGLNSICLRFAMWPHTFITLQTKNQLSIRNQSLELPRVFTLKPLFCLVQALNLINSL
jgi:hypothetical protein